MTAAQVRVPAMSRYVLDHYRDLLLYGLLIGAVAWLIAAGEQGLGYH